MGKEQKLVRAIGIIMMISAVLTPLAIVWAWALAGITLPFVVASITTALVSLFTGAFIYGLGNK